TPLIHSRLLRAFRTSLGSTSGTGRAASIRYLITRAADDSTPAAAASFSEIHSSPDSRKTVSSTANTVRTFQYFPDRSVTVFPYQVWSEKSKQRPVRLPYWPPPFTFQKGLHCFL